MSEETSESYDSGEIVWVKLGSSWWPGEVKNAEELPSEVVDFKKPPLVIVKFFDEDSYEYVKSWTNIYRYNCEKKNEFIRKGMAAFRSKIPHMEKFPKDVLKAEEKIGGNVNILSDPMFLPKKKRDYTSDSFGTPSPKTNTNKNKKRSSFQSKKDTSHITHRRFLGVDDYKAYICIQYPGKDRIPGDKEDEEVLRINREPDHVFNCHSCSFTTKRLEVMIFHTKSHIQGVYLSSARKSKAAISRRKKDKSKKSRSSDAVDSDTSGSSDIEPMRQKKRKSKNQGAKRAKVKKVEEKKEEMPVAKEDIRLKLLEAWDDSGSEDLDMSFEKNPAQPTRIEDLSSEIAGDSLNPTIQRDSDKTEEIVPRLQIEDTEEKSTSEIVEHTLNNISDEKVESSIQSEETKPVEEEEITTGNLSSTPDEDFTSGTKKNENNKKSEEEKEDVNKIGFLDKNPEIQDVVTSNKVDTSENVSKQKMDKDIHEAIKSCFDFDEDEEEDTILNRTTAGRKIPRVIPKVPRKSSTEILELDKTTDTSEEKENEEEAASEDMDAAFKELLDITTVPELPDMQNSLKCEQNFHNIKTIKFPDKPDQVGSPPKADKKDTTEVATKLTNPKKRFVKSFEDFELMQNEIRRREEEQLETSKSDKYDTEDDKTEASISTSKYEYLDSPEEENLQECNIDLSKLKSNIMSKIIEEAKSYAESKNKSLKKRDLKTTTSEKKNIDPPPQSSVSETKPTDSAELKTSSDSKQDKTSHRSPRSKILESYRNDTSKQKDTEKPDVLETVEKTEEIVVDETVQERLLLNDDTNKEVAPPKKWSRRGSHPKKDKTTFILSDVAPSEASSDTTKEKEEVSNENQTSLESDSLDKITKVNDIILGETESKSIDDTPSTEVIQEVIKPTILETESVEIGSTEIVPFQEESNNIIDVKLDENLPLTNQSETTIEDSKEEKIEEKPVDDTRGPAEDHKNEEESAIVQQEDLEVDEIKETQSNDAFIESSTQIEDVPVVPLFEKEIVVSKQSDVENLDNDEQIIEETFSSTIDDTFASYERPSATMPHDIIVIPPQKNKKRKLSENKESSGNTVESMFKNERDEPLEKKKRDASIDDDNVKTDIEENVLEKSEPREEKVEESSLELEEAQPKEETSCPESKEPFNIPTNSSEMTKIETATNVVSEIKHEDAIPSKNMEDSNTNKEGSEHFNEVEIQCASSSLDSFKFSIQTNLSILSSREEMSALALATLSEMKADLESNENITNPPKPEPVVPPVLLGSEMVPIEGNLTVVSEKDLADGQVEITSEQVISPKRPVTLSNFSMDFSDSMSDSNSNSTTDTFSEANKADFNSKGTEFNSKALTKQMKKVEQKKENTYGRLELINILEGNSDVEKKKDHAVSLPPKRSNVPDICDFEEHIPSQIVCASSLKKDTPALKIEEPKEKTLKTSVKSTASKLLQRLTTESKSKPTVTKIGAISDLSVSENVNKVIKPNVSSPSPKNIKYIMKSKHANKPIIFSEQIVKPSNDPSKIKQKKVMEDIEDVEAFIIQKDQNKSSLDDEDVAKSKLSSTKTTGKAKILQQTIITPAGEIIQPTVSETQSDDNIFDINSMPIVLSDDLLTPESIEKMPIVITTDSKTSVTEKVVKRSVTSGRIITTVQSQISPNKTITITKHKQPRILQTVGNKVVKNSPLLPNTAKPGKYIIVPQSSISQTKYLAKKPVIKKAAVPSGIVQKMPNIAPEPSGNKIMIVTNQQGQQQRLLLTPAQQKLLGYQNQKVTTKTIIKGNTIQKSVLASKSVSHSEAGTSGVISKTSSLVGKQIVVGTNANQGLLTTSQHIVQGRTVKNVTKRIPNTQKLVAKPQKTILIKNQHGQTVRKIQGTDDELLDKQVAEQLEAIKASSGMKFGSQKPMETNKIVTKTPLKRSYAKRVEMKPRGPPPLHQISKPETIVSVPSGSVPKKDPVEPKPSTAVLEDTKVQQQQPERPLNQLVIQDAVGNQTTITEGQILALPSETVDGQPQSYMLVTLDESGNLTPLNSEALMSLDPSLGLGGDLSNMVLQIDQGAGPQTAIIKTPDTIDPPKPIEEPTPQPIVSVPELSNTTEILPEPIVEQKVVPAAQEVLPPVPATANGDPGQQLIVTGDPIATQKFLESLTEGTTDLANILANAEGNSILIQADGQQILINTNTDNQMLLSMNNDNLSMNESTEGGGNPIFATQPSKNQDILAAALADTDVFQQDHPSSSQSKIGSQLSPNNTLYPMNVGNVLETSLTLSSPIMTPLEVPSTNNKKIPDDEADILTQVPKNVDLPITITDPNISQTVANQQMIANELQTNLELSLPISETMSVSSTDMNSPSYAYSLPTLDDSVEITQKPFNGSMPLLNEDVEDGISDEKLDDKPLTSDKSSGKTEVTPEGFLADEEEGRFTLGGEMCSSLSEPPPEMFDLPEVGQDFGDKTSGNIVSLQSTPDVSDIASKDDDTTDLSTHAETSSEGSCEIPLQPQIVAKSLDLSDNLDSLNHSLEDEDEGEDKKCKFD